MALLLKHNLRMRENLDPWNPGGCGGLPVAPAAESRDGIPELASKTSHIDELWV